MVCQHQLRSRAMSRAVTSSCERCRQRMQAVADLLLLRSDVRPVNTPSLSVFGESLSRCRDTILARTKGLSVFLRDLMILLHSVTAKWEDVCVCLQEICELVVSLTECCAHAAYLLGVSYEGCIPARPGIVDSYRLSRACIEIEYNCADFKHRTFQELSPPVILDLCRNISENLSVITEHCRLASEVVEDPLIQEQFKLCIKSITACASAHLNSIKYFKHQPTEQNQKRCVIFGDSLVTTCQATVAFAIDADFTGTPAILTTEAKNAQSEVLSATMSIVAPCVYLCKVIRELAYDNRNSRVRSKIPQCHSAIAKACARLAVALGEAPSQGS